MICNKYSERKSRRNEHAGENDRDSAPRRFEGIRSRLLLGFFSKLLDPDCTEIETHTTASISDMQQYSERKSRRNEPVGENDQDSAPRRFEGIQSTFLLGFFSKLLDPEFAPKPKPTLQPLSVICNNTARKSRNRDAKSQKHCSVKAERRELGEQNRNTPAGRRNARI
ncbi:hypothetical protein NE237_021516 [Protea cynaroides]|uniref:Uncharacterized protein n=1 Tax=Protea cynaroides TaxID=273540 RepID=A0A9Q0K3C5_9MAGN|nr:hypothetical protein NE237_021516 [Protea cynaroides]